jgi:hypothetical protein
MNRETGSNQRTHGNQRGNKRKWAEAAGENWDQRI